jgi:predicted transcriptional regulator
LGLHQFKLPDGLPILKTLLALAIARGRHERRPIGRGLEFFPVSITALTEIASLHRQVVVRSLVALRSLGLIERLKIDPVVLKAPRRTSVYGFAPPATPFLPLPFIHLERAEFLPSLRVRTAVNLAALKVYLLLAALRDNRSGCSMTGYEKIAEYTGLKRIDIPRAVNLLLGAGLISTRQLDFENNFYATRYYLRGLDKAPHLSAAPDEGTPLKQLPSPQLYSRAPRRRRSAVRVGGEGMP